MFTARRLATALAAVSMVVSVVVSTGATPGGVAPAAAVDGLPGDDIRLNEIQTVGSHNSYHLVPSPAETAIRRSVIAAGEDLMEYEHLPLADQFETQKVRQIELDVFVDTAGGRYANPLLRSVAGITDPLDPVMSQPGLKVLHVQDVDYYSTCLTLEACLQAVKGWSDAHPTHVPIAILLELKDSPLEILDLPFVVPEPFDAAAMSEVDSVIRSVFPADQLITPDDVRGAHATLPEAIAADGWPTLGDSRGKVMFMMDNGGGYRTTYLQGAPNLAGRAMFTNAVPGAADAAFIKRNDPTDPSIPTLVQQGYVVRTRADGDTVEARANDTGPRDAALASGAQWVSTDYPVPDYGFGFDTPYYVEIPGGTVARCNPVIAPPSCVSADLDQPVQEPPTTTTTTTTTSTSTTSPGSTTSTAAGSVSTTAGRGSGATTRAATAAQPVRATATYTG